MFWPLPGSPGSWPPNKLTLLIPLCHPLPISQIEVELGLEATGIRATAMVRCVAKTGVEMEALTAVQVSLFDHL